MQHNHQDYLTDGYNESSHFKICNFYGCGEVFDVQPHNLQHAGYTHGDGSCHPDNREVLACSECGYSKTGDLANFPHHATRMQWDAAVCHPSVCSYCELVFGYEFINNEFVYPWVEADGTQTTIKYTKPSTWNDSITPWNAALRDSYRHNYHYDAYGHVLGCVDKEEIEGTCIFCGQYLNGKTHNHPWTISYIKNNVDKITPILYDDSRYALYLSECKYYGKRVFDDDFKAIYTPVTIDGDPNWVKWEIDIPVSKELGVVGFDLVQGNGHMYVSALAAYNNEMKNYYFDQYVDGQGRFHLTGSGAVRYKDGVIVDGNSYLGWYKALFPNGDDLEYSVYIYCPADLIPPVVEGNQLHWVYNNLVDGWYKQLILYGNISDNFSNNVYIDIINKETGEYELKDYAVNNITKNQQYFEVSLPIDAPKNGREYQIIVRDDWLNKFTQDVVFANVDAKPPISTNSSYVTEQYTWLNTKTLRVYAYETGSGDPKVIFNGGTVYKMKPTPDKANLYYADIPLKGNVYDSLGRNLTISFVDRLMNPSNVTVKAYKLDGLAPVISKVDTTPGIFQVSISASDPQYAGLNGSGVETYTFSKSNTLKGDEVWQSSSEVTVPEGGLYYAYTKDKAGNISTPVPFTVQCILTLKPLEGKIVSGKPDSYILTSGSNHNSTISDSNPVIKEGYYFDGWYTAPTGGIKVYNSYGNAVQNTDYFDSDYKFIYNQNLTLYAHYKPITYEIRVYPNKPANSTGNIKKEK